MPGSTASTPLGGFDATMAGLGSMIGAGLFVVFAPTVAASGGLVLLPACLAAAVALCCAVSTHQLANAVEDRLPGGEHGWLRDGGAARTAARMLLGPYAGFFTGWLLICALLTSAGVAALTFGTYVFGDRAPVAAAVGVAVLTLAAMAGITRGTWASRFIVAFVIAVAAFAAIAGFSVAPRPTADAPAPMPPTAAGVLQGAGYMFFAFAGYTRLASMGPLVRRPRTNIPRALPAAILVVLGLYLAVGESLLAFFGPSALAVAPVPLLGPVLSVQSSVGTAAVTAAAAVAGLGGAWALIAAAGRTLASMTADGDMPRLLGTRADGANRRGGGNGLDRGNGLTGAGRGPGTPGRLLRRIRRQPWAADAAAGTAVVLLCLGASLPTLLGAASFGLLLYAAVTAMGAFALRTRPWYAPRAVNFLGLAGALLLALALPPLVIAWMGIVLLFGLVVRLSFRRGHDAPGLNDYSG